MCQMKTYKVRLQQRKTDKATKHKKRKLANFANANKVAIYQLVINWWCSKYVRNYKQKH